MLDEQLQKMTRNSDVIANIASSHMRKQKLDNAWTDFMKFGMDGIPSKATPNSYFTISWLRNASVTYAWTCDVILRDDIASIVSAECHNNSEIIPSNKFWVF
jgi:hypothetical protein